MSGGHFNYCQYRAEECFEEVSRDIYVRQRFPALRVLFKGLADILGDALHDIDWDLSGDSSIDDDPKFESDLIVSIEELLREVRDELDK